jgi:lipopolysaccharide export system protein LptA
LGSLACMKTLLSLALMLALAAVPAAATAKTLVSFEQSGGIAGLSVSVAVSTTAHVTGDVKGGDRSHRLRAATLRHLRRLLADARWDRANPGPSHCADCFVYVVRYHGHRASYDDSQSRQVPSSVRAVVAELVRISRGGR